MAHFSGYRNYNLQCQYDFLKKVFQKCVIFDCRLKKSTVFRYENGLKTMVLKVH